jgi:hypothetical protein
MFRGTGLPQMVPERRNHGASRTMVPQESWLCPEVVDREVPCEEYGVRSNCVLKDGAEKYTRRMTLIPIGLRNEDRPTLNDY